MTATIARLIDRAGELAKNEHMSKSRVAERAGPDGWPFE